MKPVRTPQSNMTLTLPGGTGDNDLPATRAMLIDSSRGQTKEDASIGFVTTWQPTTDEARRLEAGACVEVTIWGKGHPPIAVAATNAAVPERELVSRQHIDQAAGALYGAFVERWQRIPDDYPDADEFADMWLDAVNATRPKEDGGAGEPPASEIPDTAAPAMSEDPSPIPPPPLENCTAPDRVCPTPSQCETDRACQEGPPA